MKKSLYLLMMTVILWASQGLTLPREITGEQEKTCSVVSGGYQITGPSYVLPNVEYTYTIERVDMNVDHNVVELQILDPNTSASLTKVGDTTYKFICNSAGAYYIRVYGYTSTDVYYSFDSFLIACFNM